MNNGSYGGVATRAGRVFVADHETGGTGDAPQGVLSFEEGFTPVRFATDLEGIDVEIGEDGVLYVLTPTGSPGGRVVDKFDPATLTSLGTLDLEATFGFTDAPSTPTPTATSTSPTSTATSSRSSPTAR